MADSSAIGPEWHGMGTSRCALAIVECFRVAAKAYKIMAVAAIFHPFIGFPTFYCFKTSFILRLFFVFHFFYDSINFFFFDCHTFYCSLGLVFRLYFEPTFCLFPCLVSVQFFLFLAGIISASPHSVMFSLTLKLISAVAFFQFKFQPQAPAPLCCC